jgi:peptidoglycan hydrolase FlgJ
MTDLTIRPHAAAPALNQGASADAPLRAAAEAMEAGFLAEMLKQSGLGATPEGFGGGAGEDQFASFLRQEQATAMVRAGGIGLADSICSALAKGPAA